MPDCLGTLSSTLCQISALKEAVGSYVYDNTIFLKWGILNVPFCSIFVPFYFYLILTLIVPCLENIFMVLLISVLGNFNPRLKPYFKSLLVDLKYVYTKCGVVHSGNNVW